MDIRLKGGKVLDIPAGIHSKKKTKGLTFSMEGIGNNIFWNSIQVVLQLQ